MSADPRVFVGLFSTEHRTPRLGDWVNFNQPAEAVWADITAAFADTPAVGVLGVLAVIGFDPLRVATFDDFDFLIEAAQGIARYGEAFACWADQLTDRTGELIDRFASRYLGSFDSVMDYALLIIDAAGMPVDVWRERLEDGMPVVADRDLILHGPTQVHVFAGRQP